MIDSPFVELEREAGAVMVERCGVRLPDHFGDPLAEYRSVREAAGLLDGSFEGLLEVRGGERLRWLNGQITQEVKALRSGEGKPAAALNAKGRVLAALDVYGLEASVWVACQQDRLDSVRTAFDQHIIADDVQVEDAAGRWSRLILAGPTAAAILRRATGAEVSSLSAWQHREAQVIGVPVRVAASCRLSVPAFDVFVPREAASDIWQALFTSEGLRPVGMAALELLRVEAGWPWFGVDFTEQNLLLEALTPEHVSFTKGCYIGQEVVTRVEHQGHLNKRVCGLALSGDTIPAPGTGVFAGDRPVGTVGSAVRSPALGRVIALAMLRRECWEPGTALTVAIASGSTLAEVVRLPFVAAESPA